MARVAIDFVETVDDPGFVEFVEAGSTSAGEFRCLDCGYGAVIQLVVPPCPMCKGTVWERREPLITRLAR